VRCPAAPGPPPPPDSRYRRHLRPPSPPQPRPRPSPRPWPPGCRGPLLGRFPFLPLPPLPISAFPTLLLNHRDTHPCHLLHYRRDEDRGRDAGRGEGDRGGGGRDDDRGRDRRDDRGKDDRRGGREGDGSRDGGGRDGDRGGGRDLRESIRGGGGDRGGGERGGRDDRRGGSPGRGRRDEEPKEAEPKKPSSPRKELNSGKAGGAYVPPFKLAQMMADAADKTGQGGLEQIVSTDFGSTINQFLDVGSTMTGIGTWADGDVSKCSHVIGHQEPCPRRCMSSHPEGK